MLNEQRRRLLLFPHDSVRPIQDELVLAVDESLQDKHHLVVHAPTGLGKTAASLGPAVAFAIQNDLTVFFLTSRHTQHRIALDTIKRIEERYSVSVPVANLIGKKWMCLQNGVDSMGSGEFIEYCRALREDHKCLYYENLRTSGSLSVDARLALEKASSSPDSASLLRIGKEHSVCPYEIGILSAKQARVIVTDYFYLFHPRIRDNFLSKIGKDLSQCILVIDEAHNVPDRIKDLASSRLSLFVLSRAIEEAADFDFDFPVFESLRSALVALGSQKGERFISRADLKVALGAASYDVDLLLKRGDEVREVRQRSYIASVGEFLSFWDEPDEGFCRILTSFDSVVSLSFRCLDPGVVSGPLFRGCYSSILMSGTLTPTVMYSELLDLPLRTREYTFQSPFPAQNRLSLIVPVTSTKYTARSDGMYSQQAKIISDIVNITPGNSIIFFPSYALRDKVLSVFSCNKEVFLETRGMKKGDRQELLSRFFAARSSGATLFAITSGSFAEGVDFPGDALKAVVIVGLPLAKPDLETQALMKYYDEKFSRGWDYGYVFPAFNKVLQSAGRCIRSETDRGALIFLDERYAWNNYKRCFPPTWDLVIEESPTKVLSSFFSVSAPGSQSTLF